MPTAFKSLHAEVENVINTVFDKSSFADFLNLLTDDAIVIVPSCVTFIQGRHNAVKHFKKNFTQSSILFKYSQAEYLHEDDNTCVVCINANFLLSENKDKLLFHCTVIFKRIEGKCKIAYIQVSSPNNSLRDTLCNQVNAKANFEFYQDLLYQKNEVIEMVVNTINGGLKGSNDDDVFSFYYVNKGLCDMLGYTLDEFMEMSGGSAAGACYAPDLANALENVALWFAKGPVYKSEYRMRKKDGTLIWVSDTGRKFLDKDGKTRINSIIVDITAERAALAALRVERERYRLALESMDSVLFEYDIVNDIFYINESASEKNGTLQMLELANFKELLHTKTLIDDLSLKNMWAICIGEIAGPVELKAYHRIKPELGLRDISVSAKVIKASDGTNERTIGVIEDITEQKRQEEKLRHDASRDALTGLYNYSAGKEETQRFLSQSEHPNGALYIISLDDFKDFYNRFGHVFADAILINIADKLSRTCLTSDILTRLGDSELLVFLKGIERSDAIVKAGRISQAIAEVETGIDGTRLSCNIGIALATAECSDFEKLFSAADKALRLAKQNGNGFIELYQNRHKYEDNTILSEDRFADGLKTATTPFSSRQLVNFALDIFEKTNNIQNALKILLGVLGRSFNLDRITVHQIGVKDVVWLDEQASAFSCENWSLLLPKTDLYALVEQQDATGTVVIYANELQNFQPASHILLTQNFSSTVLYSIIFGAGQHVGAISFANCNSTRQWSNADREVLGEISRVIAARVSALKAVAAAEKKLDYIVNFDNITGLMSFGRFKNEMSTAIITNPDMNFVVYYIDIQSFKYINEKLGYLEGDNILKDFATFIQNCSKRVVAMTRAMADHFVVLVKAESLEEDFVSSINDMHDKFRVYENNKYKSINLMFRTGAYIVDDPSVDVALCIDRANLARKAIKHTQGSAAVMYNSAIGRERAMENELLTHMETALENEEFVVYLQPKVRLSDHKIIGAEALVRWQKQDGTLIPPMDFVPLFEKNGFITKIDRYVLTKTVEQLSKWQGEGFEVLPISVNASCLHANDSDHALHIFELLRKNGVAADMLEIELTESAIVDNMDSVQSMMKDIRGVGVKTSIDDLGAGYSVLNMIMNLPIDIVKLDRDFITGCTSSQRGINFLKQLVSMIKGLDYIVLCEGIETFEQAKLLAEIGCDLAQGYVFGRPMPIDKFEGLLHKKA